MTLGEVLGPVRDGAAQAFHLRMFMVASSDRCEVPGDSLGHVHICLVWRLSRVRCRQWLETLRPGTGAKSQLFHLDMPRAVLCGDCLVRVVGSGLRRCVQ